MRGQIELTVSEERSNGFPSTVKWWIMNKPGEPWAGQENLEHSRIMNMRTGDRRAIGRSASRRFHTTQHTPGYWRPPVRTYTLTPNYITLTDPPLHTAFVDGATRFHTTPPIIGTELNKEFIEFINLSRLILSCAFAYFSSCMQVHFRLSSSSSDVLGRW